MLEIRLLGQFDVRRDGTPVEIPSRPAQSLLAYLVLNPGTSHRRERLAGLLWPGATEANARNYLRKALWQVRQSLAADAPAGREYLVVDEISIAFDANSDYWLDTAALAGKVTEGGSVDELIDVVSVYRGELLPGFYDEWAVLERGRLQAIFEHRMKVLLDRLVAEGRWPDVLEWGERWIALGQMPEPAYRALMVAHGSLGDMSKVASVYERCVQALRKELGVETSQQTRALYERLSTGEVIPGISPPQPGGPQVMPPDSVAPSPGPAPHPRSTNLPVPLTSFIGRERENEEVKRMLSSARLLTLTGAGGSGKTRLGIQVASGLVDTFSDGAWWVELAALTDASLVPQAVATALDVREAPNQPLSETLVNHLRSKRLLLIMDNCEHLIEACARLAESLLGACPGLSILATSREIMQITAERVFQVPTLSLPDPQYVSQPERVMQAESIQLFVERAAAVKSDFALTEPNAGAVAQVCLRLDGIPLAIELAAARVKALTVEQIAARLDDRFRLLTAGRRTALPRHQTLRAMMDWSYDLLSEAERALLRPLSVFAGGWTLEAAEAVCAPSPPTPLPYRERGKGEGLDVLDLLAHLVDKSLVVMQERGGRARYRTLETIREYARERLVEAGEVETVRDRHLEFFVRFAEEAEPHLLSAAQVVWFNRLETELDNLRIALEWSLESVAATVALRLVGALPRFWFTRGRVREGQERTVQVLSSPMAMERTSTRAKALNAFGYLQWTQGDPIEARPVLEEALGIGRDLGDKWNIATSLHFLGNLAISQGDYATARSYLQESLATWRELGPAGRQGTGLPLIFLGDLAVYEGDYEQAQTLYEESVTLLRELENTNLLSYALRPLGQVALHQGDFERATVLFRESLTLNSELGHKQAIAACLAALAGVTVARTQQAQLSSRSEPLQHAALLLGAVEALLEAIVTPLMRPDGIEYHRNVVAVRAGLDQATFAAAWAEGRAMTIERAIDYGLREHPGEQLG